MEFGVAKPWNFLCTSKKTKRSATGSSERLPDNDVPAHKKKITLSIGGKNRVCAEEDPEKRKALDKRKALNNGDEVSKKNLFCPNGDGVNGEKEYKAGGIKINGCSYCCRSQTTMDKHIKMCKKIKYQYK